MRPLLAIFLRREGFARRTTTEGGRLTTRTDLPGPWGPAIRRAVRRQGPVAVLLFLAVLGIDAVLGPGDAPPPGEVTDETRDVETMPTGIADLRAARARLDLLPGPILVAPVSREDLEEIRAVAREEPLGADASAVREALEDLVRKGTLVEEPDRTGLRLPPGSVVVPAALRRDLRPDAADPLEEIRKRWPGLSGHLAVSPVGFSRDGRTAVFSWALYRGPLAWTCETCLLRLEDGRWQCVRSWGWLS